jgi:hypothetical protein
MTKGKILKSIWDNLPNERKQKIQARTDELEIEYLTLQELRKVAGTDTGRNFPKLKNAAVQRFPSGKRVRYVIVYFAELY